MPLLLKLIKNYGGSFPFFVLLGLGYIGYLVARPRKAKGTSDTNPAGLWLPARDVYRKNYPPSYFQFIFK